MHPIYFLGNPLATDIYHPGEFEKYGAAAVVSPKKIQRMTWANNSRQVMKWRNKIEIVIKGLSYTAKEQQPNWC